MNVKQLNLHKCQIAFVRNKFDKSMCAFNADMGLCGSNDIFPTVNNII